MYGTCTCNENEFKKTTFISITMNMYYYKCMLCRLCEEIWL